jgi:hypothetical protein
MRARKEDAASRRTAAAVRKVIRVSGELVEVLRLF